MVTRNYSPVTGAKVEPAKFGLLNSETLVTTGSEEQEWTSGIYVESIACNTTTRVLELCDPSHEVTTSEAGSGYVEAVPFFVQTEYECSTIGFNQADYFGKAVRAMELCQGKAVEHELWTGALTQQDENPNPSRYLASLSAVTVAPSGTPLRPAHGLALLEKALGDCGCGARGYVHATRDVASSLRKYLKPRGDVLETTLGTGFIAGTGYDGSGPNGEIPAGSLRWMYATGQISVGLGKVDPTPDTRSEAINTAINSVRVTAERPAFVTWDGCCHYAVLVDLSLEY